MKRLIIFDTEQEVVGDIFRRNLPLHYFKYHLRKRFCEIGLPGTNIT